MPTLPKIESMLHEWEVVRDVHQANYLPRLKATASAASVTTAAQRVGDKAARYLPMRDQGENLDAYEYAVRMVEPGGLLAYTVGSLAGQIAAAEAEIARVWAPDEGQGLFGSPEEEGTEAARLWADADGEGTNWGVLFRTLTTSSILYQDYWLVVDGKRTETITRTDPTNPENVTEITVERPPCVRLIPPWCLEAMETSGGILTRVQFKTERIDTDENGNTKEVEVLSDYTLGGWVRSVQSGDSVEVEASGSYVYFDDTDRTVPRLPVYRVRLPFETYHAHLWARKELSILNMQMRGDAMLNLGNSPRLIRIKGEGEFERPDATTPDGSTGSRTADEIQAGGRYHELGNGGDMRYVEPAMAAIGATSARLAEKRKAFREEAFHLMADEARQVTATEVRQRSSSGTDAILSLISSTIEEAENQALFLLAQTIAPDSPTSWREASVKRSEDFVAFDAAERSNEMTERVFGPDAIPVGQTAQVEAAKRWCETHGLAYKEEEVQASVETWNTTRGQVSFARRQDILAGLAGDGSTEGVPDLGL
ncbi:MAG: DUF4055 domain-containing protein [Bacteroidota bacterium]